LIPFSLAWLFLNHVSIAPVGFLVAAVLLIRRQRNGYVDYTPSFGEAVRTEAIPLALCILAMLAGLFVFRVGPEITGADASVGVGCLFGLR
jgi:hypothetical protein